MTTTGSRKTGLLALAFLLALFALLFPANAEVQCTVSGTPIACPFDYSVALHKVCAPATIPNAVRIDIDAPPGYAVDTSGTSVSKGTASYTMFSRDANTLYFSTPALTKNDFNTQVGMNGIIGRTNASENTTACPCALEDGGFSVRSDENTGKVMLQGAISGDGCRTDGSVSYLTTFFITNGPSGSGEVLKTTTTGGFLQLNSTESYSAENPLSFAVAVTDAASGVIYGFFQPEIFKPNDFSIRLASREVEVRAGARGQLNVSITNLGTATEAFSLDFTGLPTSWQYSAYTTRPLAPGESATAAIDLMVPAEATDVNASVRAVSEKTAVTKTSPVNFHVKSYIAVSAEIFASSETVAIASPFDISVILRAGGSTDKGSIYWTVFAEPPTRLAEFPSGSVPISGTVSRSATTFLEKSGCSGNPAYWKIETLVRAIAENLSMTGGLGPKLSEYSAGTSVSKDVSSFLLSRNRTATMVNGLLSKVRTAEEAVLSNCSGLEDPFSLAVFGVDTASFNTFESARIGLSVSGREDVMKIEAFPKNISIVRGGEALLNVSVTNKLPIEKTFSLKVSQTSFKVEFPEGSVIKVPSIESVEAPIRLSYLGAIIKTDVEDLEIVATTTDTSGEPISVSTIVKVQASSAGVEILNPPPTQLKVDIGGSKTMQLKIRNSRSVKDTIALSTEGSAKVVPSSLSLGPGEIGLANLTVSVGASVKENSRLSVTFSAKSALSGETAVARISVSAAPSPLLKLKNEITGLESGLAALQGSCRFYSLKKLSTLVASTQEKFASGNYTTAQKSYDLAFAEMKAANSKCGSPQISITMVIAGLAAAAGAFYYFKVRKKPPPKTDYFPPEFKY